MVQILKYVEFAFIVEEKTTNMWIWPSPSWLNSTSPSWLNFG